MTLGALQAPRWAQRPLPSITTADVGRHALRIDALEPRHEPFTADWRQYPLPRGPRRGTRRNPVAVDDASRGRRVDARRWPPSWPRSRRREDRPGQREMADAVGAAIDDGRHLVVQAGTGTGKSLAYLVPAILSGRRVVVTTATKALQDQLAGKDLPFLADHLAVAVRGRRC